MHPAPASPEPATVRRWPERNVARPLLSCLALAVALAWSCAQEEPAPPGEPPPRPVKSVEVSASYGERMRTFPGFAKADVRAELAFRVSGTVQRMHVDDGDVVEAGDLIAELDPVDFEIGLREIEASVAEARAQSALAESEFRRVQQLYERNNASRGEFESAMTRHESAQARVDAARQRLHQAKQRIDYTQLHAPARCGIVSVTVEEGESVAAGSAVVEIMTGDRPQVEVAVPDTLLAEVAPGKRASVRFLALPHQSFAGRIKAVGIVPAEGVITYPVTIELDRQWEELIQPGGALPVRPGMAVEARIQFGSSSEQPRHVVPTNAVLGSGSGNHVYVVDTASGGTATARRRGVEVGRLVSGGIEILAGLSDGDRVITAGLNQIYDGHPVRPLPAD